MWNRPGQLELLKRLPFYPGWQHEATSAENDAQRSSFNQAIGLPQKNGTPFPLFDYEQMLFGTLQQHKHVWIKKATGLGITEFMLRYMAWLCFSADSVRNTQMCIVTGPRIELAITLIDRMKGLFEHSVFNGR
jgi:hypothetical protein